MSNVLQFAPNVPLQVSLAETEGQPLTGQFTGQVYFTLSDNRALVVDSLTAEKIRQLRLNVGEPFFLSKQWDGDPRHSMEFSVWLTPTAEKARAAADRQQFAGEDLEEQLRLSIEQVKASISRKPPAFERNQPVAFSPLGTGTNGPAPLPSPVAVPSRRPRTPEGGKIPYNVAFREILQFVTSELRASGEQWSDQSRQDLISTCFISATKAGLLSVWERGER